MRVGIVGSVSEQTLAPEVRAMLSVLLASDPATAICIEPRYYSYLLTQEVDTGTARSITLTGDIPCDLLISIGGDGTFLRAAKRAAGTTAKVLGVNAGRLGFLATTQPAELGAAWAAIISGAETLVTEERHLITATVYDESGKATPAGEALNEVGLLRRDMASMISVRAHISDEYVATYEGDGVLIATPTGSTAYALSANGPIIHPQCGVLLVCPIAPHMLNMRPLIVPNTVQLDLSVESRTGSFLLALDGKSTALTNRSRIRLRTSDKTVTVAHIKGHYSYYATLRNKLMWGQDARR